MILGRDLAFAVHSLPQSHPILRYRHISSRQPWLIHRLRPSEAGNMTMLKALVVFVSLGMLNMLARCGALPLAVHLNERLLDSAQSMRTMISLNLASLYARAHSTEKALALLQATRNFVSDVTPIDLEIARVLEQMLRYHDAKAVYERLLNDAELSKAFRAHVVAHIERIAPSCADS